MNKCEKFVRIIPNTIKDKSLKLLSFMERETRLVSCSLAFNGNSVFCLQGFQPLQQKHSSLSSLLELLFHTSLTLTTFAIRKLLFV